MTDTIRAKVGYRVKRADDVETGNTYYNIIDGDKVLLTAQPCSLRDMKERAFRLVEIFSTVSGRQFAYCVDADTGENYITLIRRAAVPNG